LALAVDRCICMWVVRAVADQVVHGAVGCLGGWVTAPFGNTLHPPPDICCRACGRTVRTCVCMCACARVGGWVVAPRRRRRACPAGPNWTYPAPGTWPLSCTMSCTCGQRVRVNGAGLGKRLPPPPPFTHSPLPQGRGGCGCTRPRRSCPEASLLVMAGAGASARSVDKRALLGLSQAPFDATGRPHPLPALVLECVAGCQRGAWGVGLGGLGSFPPAPAPPTHMCACGPPCVRAVLRGSECVRGCCGTHRHRSLSSMLPFVKRLDVEPR
jgi:hypothetical protein